MTGGCWGGGARAGVQQAPPPPWDPPFACRCEAGGPWQWWRGSWGRGGAGRRRKRASSGSLLRLGPGLRRAGGYSVFLLTFPSRKTREGARLGQTLSGLPGSDRLILRPGRGGECAERRLAQVCLQRERLEGHGLVARPPPPPDAGAERSSRERPTLCSAPDQPRPDRGHSRDCRRAGAAPRRG